MTIDEAQRRRKAWGDKPCTDPVFIKETMEYDDGHGEMLSMGSGDYVCMTCGRNRDDHDPEPRSQTGSAS